MKRGVFYSEISMIAILKKYLSPARSLCVYIFDHQWSKTILLFYIWCKSRFIKRSTLIYNGDPLIVLKILDTTICCGCTQSYPHLMVSCGDWSKDTLAEITHLPTFVV